VRAADTVALLLLGVLLLSMPVFAIVGRGRARDPDVQRRGRTAILGYWVRDWLMWVISPIERAMVRARVSPDALNVLGALLGLGAGVAFALDSLGTAGWLILLGGVADVFDGRVARARGIASAHGAFLDSTLDRFAESFAFIGLCAYFADRPLLVLATAAALSGSLLVSYTRAKGESLGVGNLGGVMQRAERLVLLAVGALLDPLATSNGMESGMLLGAIVVVIAIGSWATATYRTMAITRELRRR
jgi:CDP-diacylglycerol---glycerol-3-phosphate 3-phosphatidyltransferase